LKKLDKETYVFDVKADELTISPLENVRFTQLDSTTLEVTIRKGQLLNRVFEHLGNQGVIVESLRNKTNRLEEIFMEMVE
jgi:ABC-2 type transport system ATP-binding protein